MANFVSPGVYVIENDVSDYPAQVNSSVVGIVGFAGKGPIAGKSGKKATLITSQASLIDMFGEPSENISGQAIEGALEILETTTSLYFVRCADDNAAEATVSVPIGGCPAVMLAGTTDGLGFKPGSTDATVSSVIVTVKSTSVDNNGVALYPADKVFTILAANTGLAGTHANYDVGLAYKKVIGGDLGDSKVGIHYTTGDDFAYLVSKSAGTNAKLDVLVTVANADAPTGVAPATGGVQKVNQLGAVAGTFLTTQEDAVGTSVTTTEVAYKVQSIFPGESYNLGTKSNGDTSGVSFEVDARGAAGMSINVNNNGQSAEGFVTSVTSGAAYLEELIGTSVITATSDYITGKFIEGVNDLDSDTGILNFVDNLSTLGTFANPGGSHGGSPVDPVNPRFVKLVEGTYGLTGGNSGIPTVESEVATVVVGLVESDGGRSGIEALDDDLLNISIALAPGEGVGDIQSVQNALVTKAEATKNFLAVLSPKFNVGKLQDAIDWSNGLSETRTAAINSSYAAIYWPWLKVFSVFDQKDRWYDPAIFAVRQMTHTDAVAAPWFAPAGFVRGRLTKPLETEVVLNQGDRDTMYSGGNVLNPVVNFPQTGIAIWGQRTSQRAPSALDRINVRRMMIYLRKVILASTQRLVFEPNDRFTWARVEDLINPLLGDISRRRGITEFSVTCDETTNTPLRVDRNEMWCKVLIKPTKTAEMVVFELNLTSQSASI